MEERGNEIPRLRCATLGMTCGGEGDGSPPPVFTGAGSRREDNGRGVFTRAGFSREGRRGEVEGEGRREWPKRDGRPLGSPLRGEGGMAEPGDEIPRLRCAALGMTCGGALGMGPRPPSSRRAWVLASARTTGGGVFTRAGSSREERRGELEGEGRREWPKRDGRPLGSPLRGEGGMAEPGDEIPRLRCATLGMTCGGAGDEVPAPVFTGDGSRREDNVWGGGWVPIREDNGGGKMMYRLPASFSRGQASLREERRGELEGEGRREWPKRDGRPLGSPLRGEGGMAEPGDEIPRLRCATLGMTCGGALVGMTCGGGGWVPAPRLQRGQDLDAGGGRRGGGQKAWAMNRPVM